MEDLTKISCVVTSLPGGATRGARGRHSGRRESFDPSFGRQDRSRKALICSDPTRSHEELGCPKLGPRGHFRRFDRFGVDRPEGFPNGEGAKGLESSTPNSYTVVVEPTIDLMNQQAESINAIFGYSAAVKTDHSFKGVHAWKNKKVEAGATKRKRHRQ